MGLGLKVKGLDLRVRDAGQGFKHAHRTAGFSSSIGFSVWGLGFRVSFLSQNYMSLTSFGITN